MKKMKTLFKRQFENHKIAKCLKEVRTRMSMGIRWRRLGNRKNRWDMLFNKERKNL